ncbi:MAG: radical SAM protein [Phycisphaerales bacterium]|nr:MAG: radical SAM protein [Phycisphaerales bacterium]
MKLSGIHLLLTYQCIFECDHCFVWGSPSQSGTMRLRDIESILRQARELGTVEWIYFEGGESFLYYPLVLKGVQIAAGLGFAVGVVSNAYWATDAEDAYLWLEPFAGILRQLSISVDAYHGEDDSTRQAEHARAACERLKIPIGVISIAQPDPAVAPAATGELPAGESAVMYRGRAAEKLASQAPQQPPDRFTTCPHEDLREPGRVHIDALGNLHICHGISLGSVFQTSLHEICEKYDPDAHPITGPLLSGGPAELARRNDLPLRGSYADACHLCCEARRALRSRFAEILMPDQMYGIFNNQ